jgi:hypothetical protein
MNDNGRGYVDASVNESRKAFRMGCNSGVGFVILDAAFSLSKTPYSAAKPVRLKCEF